MTRLRGFLVSLLISFPREYLFRTARRPGGTALPRYRLWMQRGYVDFNIHDRQGC
jgi:hypothetical protein